MTAAEVRDALRRRHPGTSRMGSRTVPGEWTCLEEFMDIDLLALSSWAGAKRIGYEVKVSRSDYRRELLEPGKRSLAVEWCHAFYFAVPDGLVTADEVEFVEPEWEPRDFVREHCTARCYRDRSHRANGTYVHHERDDEHPYGWSEFVVCPTCEGKGHLALSKVEQEAPTLWVPRDAGLIVVTGRGCRVVKKAPAKPRSKDYETLRADKLLTTLARHASWRPDPRHVSERADFVTAVAV